MAAANSAAVLACAPSRHRRTAAATQMLESFRLVHKLTKTTLSGSFSQKQGLFVQLSIRQSGTTWATASKIRRLA